MPSPDVLSYAVAHAPLSIQIGAWGHNTNTDSVAPLKIDYVRVFQPLNLYRDMEPLYQ